jgi:hypothetical protein
VDNKNQNVSKTRHFATTKLTSEEEAVFRLDAVNNFTLSAHALGKLCGYSRVHVGKYRRSPAYIYQQHRFQMSAIDVLVEAQNEAARTLKALLGSKDEKIQLEAAQTILHPTQEGLKRAAILKAINDAIVGHNNQTGEVTYKAVWGSVAEPKGTDIAEDETDGPNTNT